jgi:Tfp pilus assembly major pilin PilA
MKHLFKLLALVGLFTATAALAAPSPANNAIQIIGGANVITVCSNMTTNITCGAALCYRDRATTALATFVTVTNEATTLKISWEYSTNRPSASSTNWFRPIPPFTTLFTNNLITPVAQFVIIPPTTSDNFTQIRPFSFQNTSTTNNITNLVVTVLTVP